MYWTECYMLEEDVLLCHQTAIYTILDRHARIRAKGPKAQSTKGQSTELDQWTVEMVPSK